jgi:hypothetical protein
VNSVWMATTVVLAATLLVAAGCVDPERTPSEPEPEPDLTKVLAVLRAATSYDSEGVGFLGQKTPGYRAYEELRDRATATQLVRLTEDPRPLIRCYALRALAAGHPADVFDEAVARLRGDEAEIDRFQGCCLSIQKVGEIAADIARDREERVSLEELLIRGSPVDEGTEFLLRRWKLSPRCHERVRQLASAGSDEALIALARYRDEQDVEILQERLRATRNVACLLVAAEIFPRSPPGTSAPRASGAGTEGG